MVKDKQKHSEQTPETTSATFMALEIENMQFKVDEEENKDYRKVLFVVLHGLISLVDSPHGHWTAYVLDMGSDHRYLYGDWLAEEEMPERDEYGPMKARLIGVGKGDAEFDCKKDAVLNIKSLPAEDHPDIRAIIQLPRPHKIYYPLRGKLMDSLDGHFASLAHIPDFLSGTRVLEYEFKKKSDKVALITEDGRSWRCPDPPGQHDDLKLYFGVLHIYNEPYHFITEEVSHNRREFNKSSKFHGSDLLLTDDTDLQNIDPVPPLKEGELTFLADRHRYVNEITYLARGAKFTKPSGSGSGQVCSGVSARIAPTE